MLNCWETDPEIRPSFEFLCSSIRGLQKSNQVRILVTNVTRIAGPHKYLSCKSVPRIMIVRVMDEFFAQEHEPREICIQNWKFWGTSFLVTNQCRNFLWSWVVSYCGHVPSAVKRSWKDAFDEFSFHFWSWISSLLSFAELCQRTRLPWDSPKQN